jgi:hypothetical protein
MTTSITWQRLGDRLEAHTEALSAAEIGRIQGHATSTVTRRQAHLPVIDWPARDVLALALADLDLAHDLAEALTGRPMPGGDPAHVVADLGAEVDASSAVAQTIRRALADGCLSLHEIDQILEALHRRAEADKALATDLRAMRRGRA